MKCKLDYTKLVKLQTFIDSDLRAPLLLVKICQNSTISQVVSESLRSCLPSLLEIVYDELNETDNNPNNVFRSEVVRWLKYFERL